MTIKGNEAAERLLKEDRSEIKLVPDAVREVWQDKPKKREPIPAWKCDKLVRDAVAAARRAERKATVERIRERLTRNTHIQSTGVVLAILDEEATR